jgi:ribosomal protein L29
MANKIMKELTKLSKDELKKRIRDERLNLFQAKMKHATGQLENTSSLWVMRKTIARATHLLSQIEGQNRKG